MPVRVAEDLDLNVARALDVLLDEDLLVAEGARCLALARVEGRGEVSRAVDAAHPLAPAAGRRLDEHRVADARGLLREARRLLIVTVVARRDGHVGLHHERLGRRLRPHRPDRRRRRAHEGDPRRRARLGEVGVLREEPVARVQRLRAGALRGGENGRDRQVRLARGGGTDAHGLVGEADVARGAIGVGIDGDGAQAHAAGGLDDPAGDLAAVGDEETFEHAVHIRKMPKRVGGMGAFSAADSDSPSTRRLCCGSMTPSSQRRALA